MNAHLVLKNGRNVNHEQKEGESPPPKQLHKNWVSWPSASFAGEVRVIHRRPVGVHETFAEGAGHGALASR